MTSAEFSYLASIGYAGSVSDKRNAYFNDLISGISYDTDINIRRAGATGIYTQDATNYIKAALAYVTKGSGVPALNLTIPAGTYRITSTIVIDRIALKMVGAGVGNPTNHVNPGKGTTFIWDGPAGQPMFVFRDCQSLVLEDFLVLGNNINIPSELVFFENNGAGGQVGTNQYISCTRLAFNRYGYATATYTGFSKSTYCVRFGGTNQDNDQAWFYDCQFGGAQNSNVSFDNSNTLWCAFVNGFFDGRSIDDDTTPTAIGLRTNACTVLFNPQFNRCLRDIDVINGTTFVYMWNSEKSAQFARVGNTAGLVANGGAMVMHSDTMGTNMFDCTSFGTEAEFCLADIRFRTAMAIWPKIKVRGSSSALASRFVVRDCGIPVDAYDIQAGTGAGGIHVKIDDGNFFFRKQILNSEVLPIVPTIPLRVDGYASDDTALSTLLAQLSSVGLIQNAASLTRVARTNYLVNPRFVGSGTAWTKSANVSAATIGETLALTVNTDITVGNSIVFNTTAAAASPGESWSGCITIKVTGSTAKQRIALQINSYASNTILKQVFYEFSPGEEKRICIDGVIVPPGDTGVRLVVVPVNTTLPAGSVVTLSYPVLEKSAVVNTYFNGASVITGWSAAWTGTVDASTSTLTPV